MVEQSTAVFWLSACCCCVLVWPKAGEANPTPSARTDADTVNRGRFLKARITGPLPKDMEKLVRHWWREIGPKCNLELTFVII
jgi:hypothetical protein